MKTVRVTVDYAHDTTKGKLYQTIAEPYECYTPNSVWIVDDVGEEYILLAGEYEVLSEC